MRYSVLWAAVVISMMNFVGGEGGFVWGSGLSDSGHSSPETLSPFFFDPRLENCLSFPK